ncbi:hypothetical protein BDW22DRAFT_672830 [Trametopsis cervina]|nr:hypothetical protein BDW22DRAFT_672830 [Trametopsis cervina]
MTTPSRVAFAAPDAPGHAIVVLVLLEGSGAMISSWDAVRSYYLPHILEPLCSNQPEAAIQVVWQFYTDPYDQTNGLSTMSSTYSEAGRVIPEFHFDASVNSPLSPATLRRSIETLRASAPRARATLHLVVVAMSQPLATSPGISQPNVLGGHENWQSMAMLLNQNRVRLHMILDASPHLNVLRDLYHHTLAMQSRLAVPLWFQVDPRHSVHLSAKNVSFDSRDAPLAIPTSAPSSVPVTPHATTSSLPLSSPTHDAPGTSHSLSASPPNRRPRLKSKESAQGAPPVGDAAGPGLVNYLKQMHGLTKKRTHGAKGGKKVTSSTADLARPSSSRPILPRLELPTTNLTTALGDPKGKQTERAALEAASSGGSRYAPIAPAMSPTRHRTSDEERHVPHQPRRWPWLQPAPVSPPTPDDPQLSPGALEALRNLQTIEPAVPRRSTQLPGERTPPAGARRGEAGHEMYRNVPGTQSQQQGAYPHTAMSSPSRTSSLQGSHTGYPSASGDYHYITNAPPYGSPLSPASQVAQHYGAYSGPVYMISTGNQPSSPAVGGPGTSVDESENQPFVITPEYEALANAEFEHAVRSGAMHASMTPTVLSPVTSTGSASMHGTGSYFAADPTGSQAATVAPPLQQPMGSRDLAQPYPPHDPSGRPHVLYQRTHDQQPGAGGNAGYFNPEHDDEASRADRWYR